MAEITGTSGPVTKIDVLGGVPGAAGVGITTTVMDEDGHLVISKTNGTSTDVGKVRADITPEVEAALNQAQTAASTATTQAGAASLSASAAASSETNAAGSATAADTSAAAAAASAAASMFQATLDPKDPLVVTIRYPAVNQWPGDPHSILIPIGEISE